MGASHISLSLLLLLLAPKKAEVYISALSAVLSEALIIFCQRHFSVNIIVLMVVKKLQSNSLEYWTN